MMFMVVKHTLKEDSRRNVANALVTEVIGSHALLTDVKHLWKGFQRYTISTLSWSAFKATTRMALQEPMNTDLFQALVLP